MITSGFGSDALRQELAKTPDGRLLVSVFVQAVHDLSKKPSNEERKNYNRRKAYVWIMNDSYMLELCCWLVNVDINDLRKNIDSLDFVKSMQKDIHRYYIGRKKFDTLDDSSDILDDFEEDYDD
jgi:hypothetical protein